MRGCSHGPASSHLNSDLPARCINEELVTDLQACSLGSAQRWERHALLCQYPGQRRFFADHQ
jgi:hypothetical protein